MAAKPGREFKIKQGAAVLLAGMTQKSVEVGNEMVDITSDDDNGWQTFMAMPGKKAINITFSGVSKDPGIRDTALSETSCMLEGVVLEFVDGGTLSGNFVLASVSYEGETTGAVTFSGTLNSSGPVVKGGAGA